MLDIDQFEERAAICEFDGGMSRFHAETAAAYAQGLYRWQALKFINEAANAKRDGHSAQGENTDTEMARQQRENNLPGVQSTSEKEKRPLSEHHQDAGQAGVVLSSLRVQGSWVLS